MPIEAVGLIKQVAHLKRVPKGKLRVLNPIHMRGLEVEFTIAKVEIPAEQHEHLSVGMTLQFHITGDNRNGYVAEAIKPVELAEYSGSVIKTPGTAGAANDIKDNNNNSNKNVVVSLDLTLDAVVVSEKSLERLETPLSCGDYCLLKIRWNDWIEALMAKRQPEWQLAQVLERATRTTHRPRSHSQGKKVARLESETDQTEELSPLRAPRRESCRLGSRRRSRSVGLTLPPAAAPEKYVDQYSQYIAYNQPPAAVSPFGYMAMTAAPEMLYGSYPNFYGMSPMWMPSMGAPMVPSMASYISRGGQ